MIQSTPSKNIESPRKESIKEQALGITRKDIAYVQDHAKILAFYVSKYYRTDEKSQLWEREISAWSDVAKAKPNFDKHCQPHIPGELGFYDQRQTDVMRAQVALAREYGVYGFCFYYHWVNDLNVYGQPLDDFLKSNIDYPFCLCWAHKNSVNKNNGMAASILLKKYQTEVDEALFIHAIQPFLADPRYIRVDGKPMLLIPRVRELANPARSIKKLRTHARRLGLNELHIVVFDDHDISAPAEIGVDALVEFPPYTFNQPEEEPLPQLHNTQYRGSLFNYLGILTQSILRPESPFTLYRGIVPIWDNTAKYQDSGSTIINTKPEFFNIWMQFLRTWVREKMQNRADNFIFVNAWNDWEYGCHLEPDVQSGMAYLDEIRRSSSIAPQDQVRVDAAQQLAFHRIKQIEQHDSSISTLLMQHEDFKKNAKPFQPTAGDTRRNNIESAKELLRDGAKLYLYEYPAMYRIVHRLNHFILSVKRNLKKQG